MKAVLITQCLQRDFVGPLEPHTPHPNTLHVGRDEAQRLLGADPQTGPLAQLVHWSREQAADSLEVIHVRDWHDPDDPAQKQHLEHFGPHCLQDTRGAELVLGQEGVEQLGNEHFVNSITLNDFEGGTDLGALLDSILAGESRESVRIGVVGVWTEAKVLFLLYELMTRCGVQQLATCSALTASSSRTQHFIALDQIEKLLGARVFNSVGEFTSWLVPAGAPIQLPELSSGMQPRLKMDDRVSLDERDRQVLSYLYRDCSEVELRPLAGGFSGAGVLRVASRDVLGHEQAASVLKLGPRSLIAKERVAFEHVEPILGNDAPSVRGFVDLEERAGIKFAYAVMGNSEVSTFKQLYESGTSQDALDKILREVFGEILGRFQVASHYEPLSLFDYYTFDSRYAGSVRSRVAALIGEQDAEKRQITFPGGYCVSNVAEFYGSELDRIPQHAGESHYVAYVHGDLNAANILVDERGNVWLIDFCHTHRGHALRDLAKLENDLLYILTPIENAAQLEEALLITRALRCVKDLRAPLPASVAGVTRPELIRCWSTLRTLREFGSHFCREERDPTHLSIALLRYAVHTLSFDESNQWQKQWALAAAGGIAEDLVRKSRDDQELRVDWLPGEFTQKWGAQVGLTICPGRLDRGRRLDADLTALHESGVRRLVCLMTAQEMEWAGVSQLLSVGLSCGLQVRWEPILDQEVPSVEQVNNLLDWIVDGLDRRENCVLHCLGGLGRSGLVAACLLVRAGLAPNAAIAQVRATRGPRAVESAAQEAFVAVYASAVGA